MAFNLQEAAKTLDINLGRAVKIPATVVGMCASNKPGLSTLVSVRNVMNKFRIFNGDNSHLDDNYLYYAVYAILDEVFRAIREDMLIQVSLNPGAISIEGMAGTIPVVGKNIINANGVGQAS